MDPRLLLERNKRWSRAHVDADPEYFARLSSQQAPDFLWIGCSDSRVPANVITGLDPGEVFVHRNVANLVYPADLNCMSVLQFAVDSLEVRHIIVCGHYGCGGVRAAVEGTATGLIDHWLEPIRVLDRAAETGPSVPANLEQRIDALCEANVRAQVANVVNSPIVKRAWRRGQPLSVHGWIYSIRDGIIADLGCSMGEA